MRGMIKCKMDIMCLIYRREFESRFALEVKTIATKLLWANNTTGGKHTRLIVGGK